VEAYYQDEAVTVYKGDCLEILPQLPKANIVLADPPYNLGKDYGEGFDDARDLEEYWRWFEARFAAIYQATLDGYMYLSHSDHGIFFAKPILEYLGWVYIQMLIWWGRNGYSRRSHRQSWSYRHEPILFLKKGEAPPMSEPTPGMWFTSVIDVPRPQRNFREGRFHVAQKPVKLYEILLVRTPGELIVDPFMGSGSSLLAAKYLGRRAIGVDISEEFCELAANRCRRQGVMDLGLREARQGVMDLKE
jgi:site-specific DNA-methyltransferase (adenine-specific)